MAWSNSSRTRRLIVLIAAVCLAGVLFGGYLYRLKVQGNFYAVVDGQVYRSAQPSAGQVKDWAARYGLKAIVNLRGQTDATYPEEKAAAEQAGLRMIEARCSAEDLPSALWVRKMVEILETAPRPMLIHCAAGADRTGVASVMAAMTVGGQDYSRAKGQLSVKFGHFDGAPTHVGGFLDRYEKYCADKGLPTAGWGQFRRWAMEVYHPRYYRLEIRAPATVTAGAGQKAQVAVKVVNRSDEVLPGGDPEKGFWLACFAGSGEADSPAREFGPRVALPTADVKPGGEVSVTFELQAPDEPGGHTIHFDVVEEGRTWFARQGSPVPACRLSVGAP